MSDKPLAGSTAALVAVPLVVICCGGKILVLPLIGGLAGWFGGFDVPSILAIALVAAAAGLIVRSWLKRRAESAVHIARKSS